MITSLCALAQGTSLVNSIKEAEKQILVKCNNGCLILSPSEMEHLDNYIKQEIQKAYLAGQRGWSKAS